MKSQDGHAGLLGRGIYSVSEAGALVGVSTQRVRAWFRGWPRRATNLLATDYGVEGIGGNILSFHDLIDVRIVSHLRDQTHCSMPYLRKVVARLRQDTQERHPLCNQRLLVDPETRNVFVHEAESRALREVVTRQQAFEEILLPVLRDIEFDVDTAFALRWHAGEGIVIDPARCYGKPIVDRSGMATSILAAAYAANGKDADAVADWYGVSSDDVLYSVQFERTIKGAA